MIRSVVSIHGKSGRRLHLRLSVPKRPVAITSGRVGGIQKSKSAKNNWSLLKLPSLVMSMGQSSKGVEGSRERYCQAEAAYRREN